MVDASLGNLSDSQYFGAEYLFNKETDYQFVILCISFQKVNHFFFCSELLIATTEVSVYELVKEEFFRRLRPSLINSIKAMSVIKVGITNAFFFRFV
jgi:hypothetical protein